MHMAVRAVEVAIVIVDMGMASAKLFLLETILVVPNIDQRSVEKNLASLRSLQSTCIS